MGEISVEHYRCEECSEFPTEEIYMCRKTHLFCKKCYLPSTMIVCPVKNCEVVLDKLNPLRGRNQESFLKNNELDCRFKGNGCNKSLLGIYLSEHENNCEFETAPVSLAKATQGENEFRKVFLGALFSCIFFAAIAVYLAQNTSTDVEDFSSTKFKENPKKDEFPYLSLANIWKEENKKLAVGKLKLLFEKGVFKNIDPKLQQNILPQTCKNSNAIIVEVFIEKGFPVNDFSTEGLTPLHSAILNKDDRKSLEICKVLLESGADCNNKSKDKYNFTPLNYAAAAKGPEFAKKLLTLFQKLHLSCTDFLHDRYYYEAILTEEKAKLGISKFSTDFIMEEIGKAAISATWDGLKYLLEEELEEEANVNSLIHSIDCGELCRNYNLTYLHLILMFDKNKARGLEKIKFLVEEKEANLHGKDVKGRSLLHMVARIHTAETVEYFLSKGLDVNGMGKRGETPLSQSLENEDEDEAVKIAITLLKNGAECDNFQEEDYEEEKRMKYTRRLNSFYKIHKPSCIH